MGSFTKGIRSMAVERGCLRGQRGVETLEGGGPEHGVFPVILGVRTLGAVKLIEELWAEGIAGVVGVGDSGARVRLADYARSVGVPLVNAIHPRAVVASDVLLGTDVMIAAGAVVNPGTVLEDDVVVNTGATVDHDCVQGVAAAERAPPGVRANQDHAPCRVGREASNPVLRWAGKLPPDASRAAGPFLQAGKPWTPNGATISPVLMVSR